MKRTLLASLALSLLTGSVLAAPPAPKPTLYVIGYAHLDTQWRWEMPQVIDEFLRKTMSENFAMFERYPHYIFNFTGATRYRMMKEYYPREFERVKHFVAAGRWFPAGSAMEESDLILPSAESIFRQVLYGNQFFRREFHKASTEFMAPDCFGFPGSLPTILAHAGMRGFSTQKLMWGSAAPGGPGVSAENTPVGIPFNVGNWFGPDGRSVIAALNPGSYNETVHTDLSRDPEYSKRIQRNGKVTGFFADYKYYGIGDVGGSPYESSIRLMEGIVGTGKAFVPPARGDNEEIHRYARRIAPLNGPAVAVGGGPVRVVAATSEEMFLHITDAMKLAFPSYQGDMLLTHHSAGSLTSQAAHKHWNRVNEVTATAAEGSAVTADVIADAAYPRSALLEAWNLVLKGQFHDTLTGTCTPRSYTFTWNDDVVALRSFTSVLDGAVEAICGLLDTRVQGRPVVVYNPLSIDRQDIVDVAVPGTSVVGPDGREVPAQRSGDHLIFAARVPAFGYAVYDIQDGPASPGALKVTASSLENERYRVTLDGNGDVGSVFDKLLGRELLAAPARLALQSETPAEWPAWNMDWEDQSKPPRGYVSGPAHVSIVENGPARVALRVERSCEGSRFVQTIRLAAGSARVEFATSVDWHTPATALKATFPLTASNPNATYNWDVGVSARGNNDPRKFEVPTHQWMDLTDAGGKFGASVLTDSKFGTDKPDDNTLRLTLLYTPGLSAGKNSQSRYNRVQASQDFGHHEFVYGLAGHEGDWRGGSDWEGYRLNQPLLAYATTAHPGPRGKSLSILRVSDPRVRVLALKKAEESDEIIVRLVEMNGMHAKDVRLTFGAPVLAAREVNAQEMPVGPARVQGGSVVTSLGSYQPRTFAVRLARSRGVWGDPRRAPQDQRSGAAIASRPLQLPCDQAGAFGPGGESYPPLPPKVTFGGVDLPLNAGKSLACHGQTLSLPAGNRLYLLASAIDGDQKCTFGFGEARKDVVVHDWSGFLGQADKRQWTWEPTHYLLDEDAAPEMNFTGKITQGYVKEAPLAWFASHRLRKDGSKEAYAYSYLFGYSFEVPPGARTVTLPENPKVRIFSAAMANQTEATPLRR